MNTDYAHVCHKAFKLPKVKTESNTETVLAALATIVLIAVLALIILLIPHALTMSK
jgi:hypothetical protein